MRPFRQSMAMDSQTSQNIWDLLDNAVSEIYSKNASRLSFEELYRNAYNLVLHRHGNFLYENVSHKITSHLEEMLDHLLLVPDNKLLKEMASAWEDHRICMIMIRDILMYMDRTFVPTQNKRVVYDMGLHLFRVRVWEHERIKPRVISLLIDAVAAERAGLYTEDITYLKENLIMLLEVGQADNSNIYELDFEELFLGRTQEFYRHESLDYLSKNSASDYVKKAEERLEEEKFRLSRCFATSTEMPCLDIVEKELVERHAKTLVDMENSGFAALLKDESKIKETKAMYNLFARVPSTVDHLRNALAERVKADGKGLIMDQDKSSDPTEFVRGVLRMRERYTLVVNEAFHGESRAIKKLKESFEDFLNADARAAKCLGIYVDKLLRDGLRGKSETEVNTELEKVTTIFRYLNDKDVFEAIYKQHLAKRLLGGKSGSEDAERAMVSQLKAECGYQFTSKLEGMFNDMRISKETRNSYKEYKTSNPSPSVDIEVDVLTAGHWPSQNVPQCTLPPQVNQAINHFSEFYLAKHTHRRLSWQTSTGTAEIKARFGTDAKPRVHVLCVSTYQMCILMLFNDGNKLTLAQIREATKIPDMELRRQLISLSTPKHRILRKASREKGIVSDDVEFSFNKDYSSNLKRVKIPLVVMKEIGVNRSQDDNSNMNAVPESVEDDRRHVVEAAIVRIMKARRRLDHNSLIAEVTKQLRDRFVPQPAFIKKRIESMIERDYIERTSENRNVYSYLA